MRNAGARAPQWDVRRVLLFASTTGYQIRMFDEAARRLGVELTLATDRCHVLDDPWGDRAVAVKFEGESAGDSLAALRELRFDGVAAVGDKPAMLAAQAAEMLGVPFHGQAAARACADKFLARQIFQAAGMRVPAFFRVGLEEDPRAVAVRAPFPCVLKPLGLSASRGVIRVDDAAGFVTAFERIRKMGEREVQVESYIPGREFAVEGLATHGEFRALAIFDKPDPLEGPYFEETIYVTPSREDAGVQRALIDEVARAVGALGLRHGPVHAELRYTAEGAWMLEAHARPIGGLCAGTLRFTGGVPLEEVILRHATGEDVAALRLEEGASGVMMIPIPKGGVYHSASGVEEASRVCGVENVIITATAGQRLVPLPEGASYLGFIFARGAGAGAVEGALRAAHAKLRFEIATALDTWPARSEVSWGT
jgi:biotin carboxylase